MGAPASAYLNHTFNSNRFTGQQVNNSRAIVQADKATLLSRFYLDEIFPSVDVDGNTGFIGLVYESWGNNHKFHNPNRIGALRRQGINGLQLSYTDAGLNTLGAVSAYVLETNQNGIVVRVTATSAYYVDTDNFGVNSASAGYGFPQNSQSYKDFLISVTTGQNVTLSSFITNAEGTNTDSVNIVVGRAIIVLSSGSYASTANQNYIDGYDKATYYLNINTDSKIFTNETGTAKPPQGYYADASMWYYVDGNGVISLSGSIGDWPTDDPKFIPTYLTVTYVSYNSASIGATCNFLGRPDYTHDPANDVVIYQNVDNGKLYKYTNVALALNTLADDGFYFTGSGAFAGIDQISNGVVIGSGDCTNGIGIS